MGAAVAVVVVLLALLGCTTPPDGAEESLARLAEEVRGVDGIAQVVTSLRQADSKDRPDEWVASLSITAADPDEAIASAVREAMGGGSVAGADLDVSLVVPEGDGAALIVVDPRQESGVSLAGRLRVLPFADSVSVSTWSAGMALSAGPTFAEAAAAVRAVLGSSSVSLGRGITSVGVDERSPGAALLEVVDALDADPSTASLSSAPVSSGAPRPSLSVSTEDPSAVAELLAATADEAADAGTAPRTRFDVHSPTGGIGASGWLGLPLGSSEPADLPSDASPRPVDPAALDARLLALEPGVRAFLDEAVTLSGVPAEVATDRSECSLAGTFRVRASVVVPVFTVYDSAQEAFDAVVGSWSASGFEQTDRASGRDFWSATTARDDGVVSASIRGTPDGLSLTAESECVGG